MIPPFAIAAAVALVWYFLRAGTSSQTVAGVPHAPQNQPGAPAGGFAPAAHATTVAQATTTARTLPSAITNQPGVSGSGVPGSSPQAQQFYAPDHTPGPSPALSRHPFYGYNRTVGGHRRPYVRFGQRTQGITAGGAPPTDAGGCDCHAGGPCSMGPGGVADHSKTHSKLSATSTHGETNLPDPTTLEAQVNNLDHLLMNPLNNFQHMLFAMQQDNGEVPASQTYTH